MPSLASNVMGLNAFCSFNADAAAAAFLVQRGFASFVRNGVGDYTFTLSTGVDMSTQGNVSVSINNNAFAAAAVEVLTTTTFRVRTCTMTAVPAVAAADVDFWITVFETGPA